MKSKPDTNSAAGGMKLRISIGNKNLGKVSNKTTTWAKLISKVSEPQIDQQHTLAQYLNLSVARQGELKNVGFFVGGHCDGGVRRIGSIKDRWLITLDVDQCNPGHVLDIEMGLSEISGYEFYVYSTRKHTPDKPRLRIIFPLSKPCDAEAYHALSRIVAEKLDVSMESVDPVSYRATQLMYWPSVCKGAEFYTHHNIGEVLNPDDVLSEFGDWQDHTKLPRSERDSSNFTAAGKKPEDPELKKGLVGAFCQCYTVNDAIEDYLSDIYVDPIETPQGTRYTYAEGTTSHGAIVYDDGKFLFSNHMHDPAAGHSQNAFDLVRIHRFSDLDLKAREGTSPLSMPSVKAMIELLEENSLVKKALRDQNYDLKNMIREDIDDEGIFSEVEETGIDEENDDYDPDLDTKKINGDNWMDHLDINEGGLVRPTMHNLVLILMHDPRFKNSMRRNLFASRKVYFKELGLSDYQCEPLPVYDIINGSDWTDTHSLYVKLMMESPRGKNKPGWGLYATKENLNSAIDLAADRQGFHPVKDYLEPLEWDGVERMETVFIEYLGAKDTPYHREVCRLTLLAAVTRIYEPGHKFDYMPILEGAQGKGKSRFVRALGRNWFREMGNFDDRGKAVESMNGAWILEFAELHQFNKAEVTRIKEFLSAQGETIRLAYERNPRTFNRQCVFIGTTNESEYLRDETGNRRFWPVLCTIININIKKLLKNIDQIWAEAKFNYEKMREAQPFGDLPLYLADKKIEAEAKMIQASRKSVSAEETLAMQIETWLDIEVPGYELNGQVVMGDEGVFESVEERELYLRTTTCAAEIYEKVLGNDSKKLASDRATSLLISKAMQLVNGWSRSDKQKNYGKYGKQKLMYIRIEEEEL